MLCYVFVCVCACLLFCNDNFAYFLRDYFFGIGDCPSARPDENIEYVV